MTTNVRFGPEIRPGRAGDALDKEIRRLMVENDWDYRTAFDFVANSQRAEHVSMKQAYADD